MVKTMTLDGTAAYLRERGVSIGNKTVADGIEQGVLPFGVCIRSEKSRVFLIFRRQVDEWLERRRRNDADMGAGVSGSRDGGLRLHAAAGAAGEIRELVEA